MAHKAAAPYSAARTVCKRYGGSGTYRAGACNGCSACGYIDCCCCITGGWQRIGYGTATGAYTGYCSAAAAYTK